MNKNSNQICSDEKHLGKVKLLHERRRGSASEESKHVTTRNARTNDLADHATKYDFEKSKKSLSPENESYHTVRAILLAIFILILSYRGARYGRSEYSLLENGQAVNGFVSSKKAVITLSLGYSMPYSVVSSITACMLLYSIFSKKPHWSLPCIILCMADLVCDVGDAIMASWLFFGNLRFGTAVFYTAITMFIIVGELWIWLGVLRLYEQRTFK